MDELSSDKNGTQALGGLYLVSDYTLRVVHVNWFLHTPPPPIAKCEPQSFM